MVTGAGADTWAKVGGIWLNAEVFPFRNVKPEPIFGSSMELLKVRRVSGDNNALRNIKFEIGKFVRFIKNWFDNFEEFEAAESSSNVICTASNDAVR